jgi:3-methyladenine DNA glycosylase AlkD
VVEPAVAALDRALRDAADQVRAEKERSYLKSRLTHYGVTVPAIHRLARATGRTLDRGALLRLVVELWDEPAAAPVHERRYLAADLLAVRSDVLTPNDLPLLERLLRESRTWALVDTLAPSVVGPLSERHPADVEPSLDRWADDPDYWLRRAALLAHLIPLRQGRGDWDRFTRYADPLLEDPEFFVRKAIGWVLRDTARQRPELVLTWVEPRAARMSSITLREAVKPLDPADRDRLLASRARGGSSTSAR